jgi:hypothetical protein
MYHRKLASLALEKHTWNVQKTTWMTPRKKKQTDKQKSEQPSIDKMGSAYTNKQEEH